MGQYGQILIQIVTAFISALSGAFFGAWFAFYLSEKRSERKENARRKTALKRVLFVLVRQANNLLQLQQELDKFRNDPARAFSMQPLHIVHMDGVRVDESKLQFLIDEGFPQLLLVLAVSQDQYTIAIETSHLRAKLHFDEIQPVLEKNGMVNKPLPADVFEKKIGSRLFTSATKITDALYENVDETLASHEALMGDFHDVAKELFPSDEFIVFERKPQTSGD